MALRSIALAILLAAAALTAAGCGGPKRPGQVLASRVADLMPHGDRDHFVYLSEKTIADHPPETSLAVEHVSRLEAPGEFQITESSDGVRVGDSHWRSDDHGLSLLSEEVEGLGVRLAYDPPLLLFPQPLLVGEHRASSTGAATRLDDGSPVGLFRASVVVKSQSTRSRNPIATGDAVQLEVTRSLEGPNGALVIHVDSLNAAGIGELESVAALEGMPFVVRRSLLCGLIQGHAVGHCDELK